MKCPVCQRELTVFTDWVDQCNQPDHLYQYDTKDGCMVESYSYGGYRVHTSPEHPALHTPMTSIYHTNGHEPLCQVEEYLSFEKIQQMITMLNCTRRDLN